MRDLYIIALLLLSGLSLLFALGILVGEATNRWFFGGAMIGALLLAYSLIMLVLRRMGIIGPRKAER